MPTLRSILIIKLSSVGDVVLATPVVRHLKSSTGARIIWAVDEGIAPLLRGHPSVDELLLFPRDPFRPFISGLSHLLPKMAHMLGRLRGQQFDLAIDLQGRGRSYLLLQVARASVKVGRGRFPLLRYCIPHRRYTHHAVDANFEVADLLDLGRPLNAGLVLPAFAEDSQKVREVLQAMCADPPVVSLVPGATWPSKRWPPEYWARVADWLIGKNQRVILVGSHQETALGEKILARADRGKEITSLFGFFNLRELISLFELSSLVVTGDTGPMHIATATETPVVALFGPTDPIHTGPWPPGRAGVIQAPDCRRCRLPRCEKGCMHQLLPHTVIPAVADALARPRVATNNLGCPVHGSAVGVT